MNPSPDRSKERLPPKKRESRQGSAEHHVPLDEFKPPVPFRSRHSASRGEGGREHSDRDRVLSNPNPHLLNSPPALPSPASGLHVPLPWSLNYSSPVSLPLFPGQVSDRRSSLPPAWRDDPHTSTLPHHSRWLRGEGPLSLPPSPSSSSSSSFKTPFPASTREIWSYLNTSRRDYSPSIFSPSYLFNPHSLYPQDPSLVDVRPRYKRPNGLDGSGSRTASVSRPLLPGEYGNDRSRLDVSQYTLHANGARRQQEDLISPVHSAGAFLSDSQPQVSPEPHSSLQEINQSGKTSSTSLPTSPHTLGPDARAGRGGLLDHVGATPSEAQYYPFGSVTHPSPHPQAYPLSSSSGTLSYSLHREPGPRQHTLRNSPHSPLSLPNSHDRSQREWDRDLERDKVLQRDREKGKVKDKQLHLDKDQERESERERRRNRGRDVSPSNLQTSSPALRPSPPALLPHFTKGSLIELASGRLKRVEELRTEDFLRSADTSPEFHLSTCTVLVISPSSTQGFSHLQVHLTDRNSQELLQVLVEYPFFVQDQGWSSCSPQRTTQLYGLPCRQLSEGDVCLALTPMPTQTQRTPSRTSSRAHRTQLLPRGPADSSSSQREEMPPPPPPPPLPSQPPLLTPGPSCKQATDTPTKEQQQPRKRRWSAPDTLPSTRTDKSLLDLPHGSKLMKWQ